MATASALSLSNYELKLIVARIAFSAIGIAVAADLTASQVKSRIEAAGYTDVKDVRKQGNHFDAKATNKDGKQVALDVDAQNGAITLEDGEKEQREHKR